MKKIINGKVYDTDKARCIGGISRNLSDSLYGWSEDLYVKRTGEYFLHGDGGPSSKYGRQTGVNSWSGSSEIKPLTYAEARSWAQANLDPEEFEQAFGAIVDDDTTSHLHLTISASSAETARRAASLAGVPLSVYIEQLINNAE